MHSQNRLKLSAWLLVIAVGAASAQVYKSTDEKGNPQFSDSPTPGATEVELPPINTAEPPAAAKTPAKAPTVAQQSAYSTLAIASPENESIIPNGLSPTTVTASLAPPLAESHQLRLLLNGAEVSTGTATRFVIPRLNRGTNSLQLEVLKGGNLIQQSDPITVFAYWPGK